jgi:peptide deformylase
VNQPTPARVRLLGDPVLRTPAEQVGDVHDPPFVEAAALLVATLEDFRRRNGFGRAIAAPQIGVSKRCIAVNLGEGPFLVIDPEVTAWGREKFSMWDDCMSFPWLMVKLERHRSISLVYTDERGDRVEWNDLDLATSELLQHEFDHLDGVLAVDRAPDATALVSREVFESMRDRFDAGVDYTIPPLGPSLS